MEMTWAEKMEVEYTQKGIQQGLQQGITQGIEALRRVVLRLLNQRFGEVPESVRRKVEAIDDTEPLAELAEKVYEVRSIDDMGLS